MTALDRHNVARAIEASLTRLGTDYVDLYQTHWPDHGGRYEEALGALDDLIREGKARIIGCSNETSWGLMNSLAVSDREGFARYDTIQNNYSLNNRRFEDELAQVCRQEGVSLIPYSPLAGGVLSGKYNGGRTPEGARFSNYIKLGGRQAVMAQPGLDRTLRGHRRRGGNVGGDPGHGLEHAAGLRRLDHRRRDQRGPARRHPRRRRRDAGRRGLEDDRRGVEGTPLPDGLILDLRSC
jgi:aryl-alcohol dehydrogenase-like predicted oxidoreductase